MGISSISKNLQHSVIVMPIQILHIHYTPHTLYTLHYTIPVNSSDQHARTGGGRLFADEIVVAEQIGQHAVLLIGK